MLYLMKAYQQTMENSEFLASSIVLIEHTSVLIAVFCNRNRSISNLTDPRLAEIRKANQFFESWKRTMEESPFQVTSKHFLTRETAEDLQPSYVFYSCVCCTSPLETVSIQGTSTLTLSKTSDLQEFIKNLQGTPKSKKIAAS